MSVQESDPLSNSMVLKFSTGGSLNPANRILDLGLEQMSPQQAMRSVFEKPLHTSVAIHEITHFVSLGNTLGHLLLFLSLRANHFCRSIELSLDRGDSPEGLLKELIVYRAEYQTLLELWRPLLEGLALYAQLHFPHRQGEEAIEPCSFLVSLGVRIGDLGAYPSSDVMGAIYGGFYDAVDNGPQLAINSELGSLVKNTEFLQTEQLQPYFLGHAYIRGLQLTLAQKSERYRSCEVFFNLMIRILRVSTKRLIRGEDDWCKPAFARKIYSWIELLRNAQPARIEALHKLPTNVDIIHFLQTGEETEGYSLTDWGAIDAIEDVLPEYWQEFERNIKSPPEIESKQYARRELYGWLRANMALNFSNFGTVHISGWVKEGFGTLHALALNLEKCIWWLALSTEDLELLVGKNHDLPELPNAALFAPTIFPATQKRVRIECFVRYEARYDEKGGVSHSLPQPFFDIAPYIPKDRRLVAEVSPMKSYQPRCHLSVVKGGYTFHEIALSERRELDLNDQKIKTIAMRLSSSGDKASIKLWNDLQKDVQLKLARMRHHTARQILQDVLGRPLNPLDPDILNQGIGVVEGAASLLPIIEKSYAAPHVVSEDELLKVSRVNAESEEVLGHPLFDVNSQKSTVLYCGLWGPDPQRAAWADHVRNRVGS